MEDFAPYELAVKLKQKGFKQGYNIFGYRPIFSDETTIKFISDIGAYEDEYFGENITAPTISQVLKWLREEKKIFIDIRTSIDLNGKEHFSYYIIYNKVSIREGYTDFDWKFEQAALAGIEYVIDNLI